MRRSHLGGWMLCGSDPQVAISKPLMFNIRRFIKQHRSQIYDDSCLASLPIFVYNDESGSLGKSVMWVGRF